MAAPTRFGADGYQVCRVETGRAAGHRSMIQPRSGSTVGLTEASGSRIGGGCVQAFLNLSKAMIGGGLLAMPHVLAEAGLLRGVLLLVGALVGAGYGMNLVLLSYLRYTASVRGLPAAKGVETLADLTHALLGTAWRRAVEVMTIIMQFAFCLGHVYVILDTAEGVLGVSREVAALGYLPVAVLLGSVRRLRGLWFVSALGLIVFVFGVMISTLLQGAVEGRGLVYQAGDRSKDGSPAAWFSWMGSFLYSVEAINHVMPNATSLDSPSNMSGILASTFVVYFLLVGSWQVSAAMYGYGNCDGRNDIVLQCLTPGVGSDVIRVAVAVTLVFSIPITIFPAVQMLEAAMCEPAEQERGCREFLRAALRPILSVLIIAMGLTVRNMGTFTGLVGSTVMSMLGFVVPVRLHAAACALPSSPARHPARCCATALAHGLLVSAASILAAVETLAHLGYNPWS